MLRVLADGLAGNVEHGSMTFDLLQRHVARGRLVGEAAIADAMRWLLDARARAGRGLGCGRRGGAAATAFATDGPVVVVLTGRNVAAAVLRQYVLAH